jgi:hypothetical protein
MKAYVVIRIKENLGLDQVAFVCEKRVTAERLGKTILGSEYKIKEVEARFIDNKWFIQTSILPPSPEDLRFYEQNT